MTTVPRRQQKQIFIRSDKAALMLNQLAQHGRTKVSILEDALLRAVSERDAEEMRDRKDQ